MSTNLQTLLRDGLLNNSYDYTALHDTLKDTWTNSYSYLYQLQKSYIEYEERTFLSNDTVSRDITDIGHLYINRSLEVCFDIDYDFIHVINREEFKRSKFYTKRFTYKDMVDNPQIFDRLPIIIIDDKAIWDYEIYANKGTFTIILPFARNFVISNKRNPETNDIVYLEHKVQVFITENVLYERLTLNKTQVLDTKYKAISLDMGFLSKTTSDEGFYFLSVHIPNSLGNNYELGTQLLPCTVENNKLRCRLSDTDYSNIIKHTKNLYISVIFINKLHLHKFYTGNTYTKCENDECNLFILQRDECVPYAMPIPVENLMIIRKRDGLLTYVHNTDAVELFYPNIYHIKDKDQQEGDIYYVYYFYKYAESLKYTPLHDFYYEFLKIRYKGYTLENIVDKLYQGYTIIDPKTNEEVDFDKLNRFKAKCGDSFSENDFEFECEDASFEDNLTEYILVCGDTNLSIEEKFLQKFYEVLNYQFFNHRYGDIDFVKRYLLEDGNKDKDSLEYKDETLRTWISEDPMVLRDYVLKQNKLYNSSYHLYTKSINLKSRSRISTAFEMHEDGYALPEECYVFAFRNSNTTSGRLLNIRVFVDGLFVSNMIHDRYYFTDYFYIPVRMVTDNSYIEIEVFPSYEHTEKMKFTSLTDEKEIDLLDPADGIYPTAEDVYYIAPTGHIIESLSNLNSKTVNTTTLGGNTVIQTSKKAASLIVDGVEYQENEVYNNSLFRMTARYTEGDYEIRTHDVTKPVKYTRLNKFKIRPLSESILNKDVVFCISKVPNIVDVKIESDDNTYPYISLAGFKFNYNVNYFRIFKNGRLIPRSSYLFSSALSFPRIIFLNSVKKGDVISIDITPYKYKEVYYLPEIKEDQKYIDVEGFLDKPFDIRYYDVYLNGRKLSLNNVISISAWKFALINIKSRHHLQIFEKERDYEFYGFEYQTADYFYTIDELIKSDIITEEEVDELIDTIIFDKKDDEVDVGENEDTEEIIDFISDTNAIVYNFYHYVLIPETYANPDTLQYSKEDIESTFSTVHETYFYEVAEFSRNQEEHDRRVLYEPVYLLDPDVYVEGINNTDGSQDVYIIGHPEDVDEEILNQSVDENIMK